jgi:cytochrome c553
MSRHPPNHSRYMLKRLVRWLAYAGAGLVALLLVAACVVYAWSSLRFVRKYTLPPERAEVTNDSVQVARGQHLATAVLGCTGCHAADLGGEVMFNVPPVARLVALNLTRGRNGAGARYTSYADWEHAIRHGIGPDGRPLKFMPAWQFNQVGDDDLRALIAYLGQLPPVTRAEPSSSIGPLGRLLYLTGQIRLLSAETVDHGAPHRQAPEAGPTAQYGEYLSYVSGCRDCHGDHLSGGRVPGTPSSFKPAANLTPAGIGQYTQADFVRALREGVRPSGTPIDSFMPVRTTKLLSDDELHALYAYLRTVPPREYGNR